MSKTVAECLRFKLSVLASAARNGSRKYVECGADVDSSSFRNGYACQGC
jgi:hypothetical protein